MAETAAHLVDHVIPPLPVRQWGEERPIVQWTIAALRTAGQEVRTGLPHQGRFRTSEVNRSRLCPEREPRAISAVLHMLLRVIEAHLRQGSDASSHARLGAVSFIHRFGASLNCHVYDDENLPGSGASPALSGAQIRSRRIGHCCVIDGVFEPVEEAGDTRKPCAFAPPLT